MQFKDYYQVLGVARDADEKAIKSAYRKKARQYHPDVNKGDASAEERFKELNEAYEVLKDSDKRSRYDRFGADWERYQQADTGSGDSRDFSDWFAGRGAGGTNYRYQHQTGESTGFSDFFETLFGDSFGRTTTARRTRTQPQRGQDYEQPVEVTLQDAYRGTTRRFDLQIQERCESCGGTGLNGTGLCPVCGGNGSLSRARTIEVKIPAGVRTGSKIRVAGQGAPGLAGGPNGDIYLTVTIRPDERFELDGDNIRVDVEVPLYTAMLGGEARVPTLDGAVELTIPPETQNGQVFRLRGKGMPSLKGGTRGDLLARVKAVLPRSLSDEEKQLVQQLQELRSKITLT